MPTLHHTHTLTRAYTYTHHSLKEMEALEPDLDNDPEPLDLTFTVEEVQFRCYN